MSQKEMVIIFHAIKTHYLPFRVKRWLWTSYLKVLQGATAMSQEDTLIFKGTLAFKSYWLETSEADYEEVEIKQNKKMQERTSRKCQDFKNLEEAGNFKAPLKP